MVNNQLMYEPRLSSKTEARRRERLGVSQCSVDVYSVSNRRQALANSMRLNEKLQTSANWPKRMYGKEYEKNDAKWTPTKYSILNYRPKNLDKNLSSYDTMGSTYKQSFRRDNPSNIAGKALFTKVDQYIEKLKKL
eukprot:TRINITY_DN3058_c0_g1_i2.p2 TRINITY_DN3058_c0_g1~~TRINITY_DN3058_c0_g1_i2.p2  ORF type:complete len:136 (-),score=22.82 TRINITY_DN3058_c0_g1_i2:72-479(-)